MKWGTDETYMFEEDIWEHIVLISDGVNTRYYRNGAEVSLVSLGTLPVGQWIPDLCSGVNYFWLGKQKRSTEEKFFSGKIDDVRIYKDILTDTEIIDLYGSPVFLL